MPRLGAGEADKTYILLTFQIHIRTLQFDLREEEQTLLFIFAIFSRPGKARGCPLNTSIITLVNE